MLGKIPSKWIMGDYDTDNILWLMIPVTSYNGLVSTGFINQLIAGGTHVVEIVHKKSGFHQDMLGHFMGLLIFDS